MNWGTGLVIAMVAFMIMILSFVYRSTQQDFSLVTKNYYEESLDYDAIQQMRSNYIALDEAVKLTIDPSSNSLIIQLPASFEGKAITGNIQLYSPVDANRDRKFSLEHTKVSIPLNNISAGRWKVKIDWETDQKGYLFEKSQFIN